MISRLKEKLGNVDANPVVKLTSIKSPLKRKTSENIGDSDVEIIENDNDKAMTNKHGSPSKEFKSLNLGEVVENSYESDDDSVGWMQTPDISVHSKTVEDTRQESTYVADKKNSSEPSPFKTNQKTPKSGNEITYTIKQGNICTRLRTRENAKRKDITLVETSESIAPDSADVTEDAFDFKTDSESRSPTLRKKRASTNPNASLKKDSKLRRHSVHTNLAFRKIEAAFANSNDVTKKLSGHPTPRHIENFDKTYPTDVSYTTEDDSECISVSSPIARRTRNASGSGKSLSSEISAPPIEILFTDSCFSSEISTDDFTKHPQRKDIKSYSTPKIREHSNRSDEEIDFMRLMSAKTVGDEGSPNKNSKVS